jgi:hypothetical protein
MAATGRPSTSDAAARGAGKRVTVSRLVSVAAIGMVAALAISACGGGSPKTAAVAPATTSTTAADQAGAASRQAYTQCMQSHGVDVSGLRGARGGSTPSSLPAGVTQQQFDQAMQACRSLLPAAGGNFQNNPAFAAYRNCLMLHGVTLPAGGQGGAGAATTTPAASTPGTTAVGGAGRGLFGLDPNNPTVAAALQACAALRPASGGGGTTTTAPAA